MVEQEATIQGIRMSRGVKLVLITKQETIVIPIAELTITKCVLVAVRVRYNEPKHYQQNGNIGRKILRDWSRGT